MKQGILFIAPIGARSKRDSLFREIVSTHPDNNFSSVLFLGPNNFVLAETRRQFFSYLKKNHNQSAYIPFQTSTIKQLAGTLHELAEKGRDSASPLHTPEPISGHMRTLVLCEVLKDNNIGYARILSDLFRKTRHYALNKPLSQVKEEISALIFEEKARDRAVRAIEVLQSYEDALREKDLIDQEDLLRDAVKIIQGSGVRGQGSNPTMQKGDTIPLSLAPCPLTLVVAGFFDPTPLEMEIVMALMDKAEKTYVLAEEGSEISEGILSQRPGMEARTLERNYVRGKTGYFTYPSMEDEVEGIAKDIKRLILEGMKPWEITVSFPVLARYLPMVRRVFKKHGIPLSIGEYDLSNTKPLSAIDELINCIVEDYPRTDFLSVLTSPHFPLVPAVLRERAVGYSYKAGIVKGRQSWLSIKAVLQGSNEEGIAEEEKKRLDDFQKEINIIIDVIEGIKQKRDLLLFIDEFETALTKWGFFDSLKDSSYGDDAATKLTGRFSELRRFAGMYKEGLKASGSPEFYLRYLLQDIKGFDEKRDGVKIIPYELAAGIETGAFFFGGVLEGDFPSRPGIDPILPEKVKKALGMPYLEYYLERQKHYFRRLLHVSRHDPVISCPAADGDKLFLPSPFLDWGSGLPPVDLNIYSEEDVQVREGELSYSGASTEIFPESGLVFDKAALGILRRRTGVMSKGHISVTDIDFYRKCPLRFYIERLLHLEMERPPRFEVESRLWGSLAHKTMESLFKNKDVDVEAMEERLFKCLDAGLRQFPIGDFWSKVAREIFRKLLPLLKAQETEIREMGFAPFLVEEKLKVEINGLKLKGKLDRIDMNVGANAVRLLDYKTGTIDNDSLQMPLYAGMWQANFSSPVESTGYYSLKEGRVQWSPKKIGMDEFIQTALEAASEIINKIKKCEFPAAPFKDAECRYCYHSPVCRK